MEGFDTLCTREDYGRPDRVYHTDPVEGVCVCGGVHGERARVADGATEGRPEARYHGAFPVEDKAVSIEERVMRLVHIRTSYSVDVSVQTLPPVPFGSRLRLSVCDALTRSDHSIGRGPQNRLCHPPADNVHRTKISRGSIIAASVG